jgi:hypothetical protein
MPECYADTLMIEALVPSKTGYNHKHSCYKVESAMKMTDNFSVGIIDKDKRIIPYLDEFEIVDKVEGSLILLRHNTKHQFIIQIRPALEMWILNVCEAEEIDLTNFGLSNNLMDLKRYTKRVLSIKDRRLTTLFTEISTKDNNESVRKLKWWIQVLKQKNYNTDINELKNG